MLQTENPSELSPKRLPTIKDVAAMAHVSVATVSKVLTEKKSGITISQQTRLRVKEAARILKYTPNNSARALRRQSLEVIGFYFPNSQYLWSSHDYASLIRHINVALEAENYSLTIMTTAMAHELQGPKGSQAVLPRVLARRGVDGVICVHEASGSLLADLEQLGLPYVLLNCQSNLPYNVVNYDEPEAALKPLEYLWQMGHRKIWFMGRTVGHPSYAIRRRTYEEFMQEKGLYCYPDLRELNEPWLELQRFGELALKHILAHPDPPTAISAYTDISALALLHIMRERGIKVPEEISLIGGDDIPEAAISRPQLTTLQFPAEKMAKTSVEMILSQIRGEGALPSVAIPPCFIERVSCGPPRKGDLPLRTV